MSDTSSIYTISGEIAVMIALTAKTKGDIAYQRLRRAIVTFEIAADVPLEENDLMARYDVGRTPLCETHKRLAQEGYIVWLPHRSPYVREVSFIELAPLYETRLLLEVPVASLAAERITDEEIAGLDTILDRLSVATVANQVYEAVELDHELHAAIARGTHNRYLVQPQCGC